MGKTKNSSSSKRYYPYLDTKPFSGVKNDVELSTEEWRSIYHELALIKQKMAVVKTRLQLITNKLEDLEDILEEEERHYDADEDAFDNDDYPDVDDPPSDC